MQALELDEGVNFIILASMDIAAFQFVKQVVMRRESVEYKLTRKIKAFKSISVWIKQYLHREDVSGIECGRLRW